MHVVHTILSWIATIVFLPTFGAVMVLFDVAQRVAYYVFGTRAQEYVAGAVQWVLVRTFGICGTHLAVERDPAVRSWTPYIVVSNHQSMFDIVILGSLLFSNFPKYISKRSLGRWIPTVSFNLRAGGHVLIDRGDAPQALSAIRDLGKRVRAGRCSAMIFPEGTRARAGELGKFKPAGTLALFDEAPETPVLPVAIDQSWKLLRHNYMPVPFGTRVRVWLGAPISRVQGEDPMALLDRVRGEIDATLTRWRQPSNAPR
jgi:1-acyl-sn-glycerol-3-phosphate acyltransferase